jgi:hypothetical protein
MRYPIIITLTLLLSGQYSAAQDTLECPEAYFFQETCPSTPQPTWEPPPQPPAPSALPLYTRQGVTRDTPDVLLEAINTPTPATVQAYIAWERQRWEKLQQFLTLYRAQRPSR